MKKSLFLLTIAALLGSFLFVSCDTGIGDVNTPDVIDLTGIYKIVPGSDDWNEGDEYAEDGFFTEISIDDWAGSVEDSAANFVQVSPADPADGTDIYLLASVGYGASQSLWRIYGTDPETGIDNGFVAGDTVTVTMDIMLPDLSVQLASASPAGCNTWFEFFVAGTAAGAGYTMNGALIADGGNLVVKYEADTAGGFDQGTPGMTWKTFIVPDILVDVNGVVDIMVNMGTNSIDTPSAIYFNNITVTKQ